MKLNTIFALLMLIAMAKGTWLAAAAQPVILGLGALLGALNMDDVFDAQPIILEFVNYFADESDKSGCEKPLDTTEYTDEEYEKVVFERMKVVEKELAEREAKETRTEEEVERDEEKEW